MIFFIKVSVVTSESACNPVNYLVELFSNIIIYWLMQKVFLRQMSERTIVIVSPLVLTEVTHNNHPACFPASKTFS